MGLVGGTRRGIRVSGRSGSLVLGEWNHVVVTRQGSTVRWYLNGVLDRTLSSSVSASVSSLPLVIGSGYAGGYAGDIDEVAVYDHALSGSAVQAHYNAVVAGDQTAYGSAVLGDSPVSYWRLDEDSGSVALDETGANPGAYQGTPSYGQPGADLTPSTSLGSSVGFSGDDAVVVADDASLELTGDLSFELWLKPSDFSQRENPLGKAYSGEGMITQEVGGRLQFFYGSGGGNTSGYQGFWSLGSLVLGEWNHVVVTRQGSTVRWYLNGVLDRTLSSSVSASVSSLPLVIGSGYAGGYAGDIDEVAVYDHALSGSAVQAHYNAVVAGDQTAYGSAVLGDSPVSYWRLDEDSGSVALDETGANPGAYQGTPSYGQPGATVA